MRKILILAVVLSLPALPSAATEVAFLEPRGIPSPGFPEFRSACEAALGRRAAEVSWTRVVLPAAELAMARRELEAGAPAAVYVTAHTTLAQAAAASRPSVPLLLATLADPADLGFGHVDERRTANVTGFTYFHPFELKHLEIIREMAPAARTIGIVADTHWSSEALSRRIVADSRHLVGVDVKVFRVTENADLPRLDGADAMGVDAWFVPDTPPNRILGREIAARLARWNKPTIGAHRSHLDGGGVLIYEPERIDHWRRLCGMLKAVLSGTPAREIAFDRPKAFRLVVNAGAARRMNLRLPEAVLKRADEVLP